ncbi:Hypothetical predicted protein [Paramuricea clavata]|uniref:Uncharacterized protein n=1 Tax=Paramuricea clavata TaxID=317549 RepID=A0A6S7GX19_PARCT|nr:Hypothetical predicted protein [Paramuricea clavata]
MGFMQMSLAEVLVLKPTMGPTLKKQCFMAPHLMTSLRTWPRYQRSGQIPGTECMTDKPTL